jgi:hypothetical protein
MKFIQKAILLSAVATLFVSCASANTQPPVNTAQPETASTATTTAPNAVLEVVAELPLRPWNIAVTREGRIFATVFRNLREEPALIEVTGRQTFRPFPDAEWNGIFGSSPDVLNRPHGIHIDEQNRLWVIDYGQWAILPDKGRTPLPAQTPKLLAFDVNTGKLVYRLDFGDKAVPTGTSFPQDLVVDEKNGFVYLADSGIAGLPPAIIVVDLNRKTTRRFEASPSLKAEDVNLVVEDKVLAFPDKAGKMVPARIGINPISLSADRETLFYGAMNGTSLYALPTELLRSGADDAAIATAVKRVGSKAVSDGISTDTAGNHFITNVNENAIDVLDAKGKLSRLVQDERLIWTDSTSFGEPDWLYINPNQLNRSALLNANGKEEGQPPYLIMRIKTGTEGTPGS